MNRLPACLPLLALSLPSLAGPLDGDPKFVLSMGQDITVAELDVVPGLDVSTRLGATVGGMVVFATVDAVMVSAEADGDDVSAQIYTVGAGARYFLSDVKVGEAATYVAGEVFVALPKTEIDDDTDKVIDGIKTLGLLGGFGGEFFATKSVSVSGEVGLMRFAASYDEDDYKLKASALSVYSSVLLSFYL